MAADLSALVTQRKSGFERFCYNGGDAGFDLLSFWQWSVSDLVSNATRGVLAEYIVARALGVADGVRNEWDAFDLRTKTHVKVEVKSAAYVQSWYQRGLSRIVFTVGPRRGWDPKTNVSDDQPKWQAEVYVFALLTLQEKESVDPLKLEQWEFYVLPVSVLQNRKRSQHSITLKSLQSLCPLPVRFVELAEAIHRAGGRSEDYTTMATGAS
jgi:hypothetical protein